MGGKRQVAAAFSGGTHHLHLDRPQTLVGGGSEWSGVGGAVLCFSRIAEMAQAPQKLQLGL